MIVAAGICQMLTQKLHQNFKIIFQ